MYVCNQTWLAGS